MKILILSLAVFLAAPSLAHYSIVLECESISDPVAITVIDQAGTLEAHFHWEDPAVGLSQKKIFTVTDRSRGNLLLIVDSANEQNFKLEGWGRDGQFETTYSAVVGSQKSGTLDCFRPMRR